MKRACMSCFWRGQCDDKKSGRTWDTRAKDGSLDMKVINF